ncbi:hypothetical protein CRE_07588 [Caenorhabditis remanei]|uniref:Uncharacterized protein n=1 Tax=Caenorhabditis remanei TaxID=31234 RepID=E3MP55_CAERE|nr:hypothetical protein CRE_07588 [Caenorhabditis remanei]
MTIPGETTSIWVCICYESFCNFPFSFKEFSRRGHTLRPSFVPLLLPADEPSALLANNGPNRKERSQKIKERSQRITWSLPQRMVPTAKNGPKILGDTSCRIEWSLPQRMVPTAKNGPKILGDTSFRIEWSQPQRMVLQN